MKASVGQRMMFVDFNIGTVQVAPLDGRPFLVPTILEALSHEFGNHSVRVPGHDDCTLQGGETDGSLSIGVFQNHRPLAVIYVGCGEGASGAWESTDGLCHRTFGSPLGQLMMPASPWTVLIRFPKLRDSPSYDCLTEDVGFAWAGQSTISGSP